MIKLDNISKKFENNIAVNRLSLEIPEGKIFGFLGPNGAGKSTTIKMITGILLPDSGTININGLDFIKESLEVKRQLAYVPDEPTFFEHMTGIQYLNFIANIFELPKEQIKNQIEKYSDYFKFTQDLNKPIPSFCNSRGGKEKLALIAAFMHDPKIIILDEPMGRLDPDARKKLKDILREFAQAGNTVFYSTHILNEAEGFCDLFAIIKKGKLIVSGTFEDLQNKVGNKGSTLEDVFLKLTDE